MPDRVSDTPSLSITELTGQRRWLRLAGRALPYQGVAFPVKMRASFTWYAGNPVASTQMVGSEDGETTMTGRWSDRFLQTVTTSGQLVEPEAVAELDGLQLASVADLVETVDNLLRQGQEVEVVWNHVLRRGQLLEFEPTWRNVHDCEWSMRFQWTSRGEPTAPVLVFVPDFSDTASSWQASAARLRSASDPSAVSSASDPSAVSSALQVAQEVADEIDDAVSAVEDAVGEYVDTVSNFVSAVLTPLQAAQRLAGVLETIKTEAGRLVVDLAGQADRSILNTGTDVAAALGATDENDMSLSLTISASAYVRGLRKEARAARDEAASEQRALGRKFVDPPLLDIVIAREGQDLRDLATEYYGTPDAWRELAIFNHLSGSALAGRTVVLIPERRQRAA